MKHPTILLCLPSSEVTEQPKIVNWNGVISTPGLYKSIHNGYYVLNVAGTHWYYIWQTDITTKHIINYTREVGSKELVEETFLQPSYERIAVDVNVVHKDVWIDDPTAELKDLSSGSVYGL